MEEGGVVIHPQVFNKGALIQCHLMTLMKRVMVVKFILLVQFVVMN